MRILNYVVTSNHIHLLVVDSGPDVIPKSLQLIAGRTAQEYNQRKQRQGAFWEDSYHATAIEQNEHLIRCLVYIDLNMVRTGVVNHPSEWEMCGFNEIQSPPERYGVIDVSRLWNLCGFSDSEQFCQHHWQWVQEAISNAGNQRESYWTEGIAVGSIDFVEEIRARLDIKGTGRRIEEQKAGRCVLREDSEPYSVVFDPENRRLSPDNSYFLDILPKDSMG